MSSQPAPTIAIACGGTGGHLFPGLAVAEQLVRRGCKPILLISPKDVDQQAVKAASGMDVVTLPAVGLTRGRSLAFLGGFIRSYRAARKHFKAAPPRAALAMGGFTAAPPILAAKRLGARTFLHESNVIPGRANRRLAWMVDEVFVGFPQAAARLRSPCVLFTGTPVRRQFQPRDAYTCRVALGLDPARPVLLVMGGSQGATSINDLVTRALPLLCQGGHELQLLHLAGPNDAEKIRAACLQLGIKAIVHTFLTEMELALGAATVAVSRAGASSLAELAAMRLPSVLIPYPAATDDHQSYNARAFEETGAARLLKQKTATPESLARSILELMKSDAARESMRVALAKWHFPNAAEQIAEELWRNAVTCTAGRNRTALDETNRPPCSTAGRHQFSAA